MYNQPVSTHYPIGARGRTRGDAEAPEPHTRGFADSPADRRASFRHDQSLDGSDALPDQDDPAREYRDEFACTGPQHETRDADPRNRTAHGGNEGLNALFSPTSTSIIQVDD